MLLRTIDGIKRTSEIFARARFYLDEDECIAVAANNVNLATPASAKISIKNPVAVAPQESAGKFFTAPAMPKVSRPRGRARKGKPVAPPVRKIGDGSGKDRIHGVS